jgi:acyl dehydratase
MESRVARSDVAAAPEPAGLVSGPFFDDLRVGDTFAGIPSVTLTSGLAATHQSIVGDNLRLALDAGLAHAVSGADAQIAHPALVWDIAIGQSTEATREVVANLFYRGLTFHRVPVIGDTMSTRTEVVALRQNRPRHGRAATGMVGLRITTRDQHGRSVLDFWRCAMLPLRRADGVTGHSDDLDTFGLLSRGHAAPDPAATWDLGPFRTAIGGAAGTKLRPGTAWQVGDGDIVTSAPELARLCLNAARAHRDPRDGAQRLVYGGHTVAIALAQAARVVATMVYVVGWLDCVHVAPVREGDTLWSTVTIEALTPRATGGSTVDIRSQVQARPQGGAGGGLVLDWRFTALVA